ncbi:hypothetical protein RND81_14G148500 [Saponaria officinalis]|uniref:Pyrrolo-quinoline quinone repeat domain-containing protein n=1 Tax=Saponaria officinalis TaxID=3572 RepID=A0AAW1GQE9_SAPOF
MANGQSVMVYFLVMVLAIPFLCLVESYTPFSQWSRKPDDEWLNHGGNVHNQRYAAKETKISPKTAPNLHLKWKYETQGFISGTPSIYKGTVYFSSFDGNIYAVMEKDGSLVWKQNLHQLTGFNATGVFINGTLVVSRATPSIAGDLLVVGMYGPAVVLGLERSSGELVWMSRLDSHPYSLITMSGTYYNGAFYVGVSSLEETAPADQCCTFRGSFAKLDAFTGKIIWQTYMLPDNKGKQGEYAGAAIWGSSPSIDISRNHIYVATGNLYSVPETVEKCQEKQNNQTVPTHPDDCIEADNHFDSILALDLDTGNIEWYHQLGGYDVWFLACNDPSVPNCPPGPNPDADFGEAPMLLSVFDNGHRRDLVVAVQKSGFAWALDRDSGNIVWSTEAGPGGLRGGGIWGAATDETRVYTNIANSDAKNFTLKPSNKVVTSGGWVAIDPKTGTILWSTANPGNATAFSPVSVANGVVFAGSFDNEGTVFGIEAETGSVIWSYKTGFPVYNGGVSVGNGCIYVGNGYFMTGGMTLFAFCV